MKPTELPWTGERLVPSLTGDIVLEHLHRYLFAMELAAGRDVLDIACGEGYGGNLLASRARSVTGVDISLETIQHARSKYSRANLSFLQGSCAAIPMPDKSVDLVVSFETLEHFVEHEQFLREVRRVLRDGGVFVVSTPDKSVYTQKLGNRNQFHPKELEAADFEKCLTENFAHVQILNQRVALGSFLAPTGKCDLLEVGTHRGNFEVVHFTPGAAEGVYLVGVASNSALPSLKVGIFEFGQEEAGAFVTPLLSERTSAETIRHDRDNQITDLNQALASKLQAVDLLNNQRVDLERSISERDSRIASLNHALTSQNQTVELLRQTVESALRWQKSSWFKRAFHRWHPPSVNREKAGFLKKLERSIRKRRKYLFAKILTLPAQTANGHGEGELSQQVRREGHSAPPASTPGTPASRGIAPASGRQRIVFVSGEAHTPGHSYRVEMVADSLSACGYEVLILPQEQLASQLKRVNGANALVIWRAAWSKSIAAAVALARRAGTKVVFDIDDLMIDPALARIEIVDGIRSQNFKESTIADLYRGMQETMMAADFCTCTTKPLATAMRRFQKTTFVIPNGFDDIRYRASRKAAAEQDRYPDDGLVRIGYAGGSRTHQKDLACAVPAVARILKEYTHCRLVLFHLETPAGYLPCLDVHEFPELAELGGQIEWRRIVPFQELPAEITRFDINLAPLEVGNAFCEAKSELKYFEAAIVNVPTVASPTIPYAETMIHGRTGFLAGNTGEWYEALKCLVEAPDLRRQIGKAAFLDVLWRFGPERRAQLAAAIFEQILRGDSASAAGNFELELRRTATPRRTLPEWAEFEVMFEAGSSAQSEVAVVIPLHNYEVHVIETLESVKAQTLGAKELIVVEDCSTDDSLRVAKEWMQRNASDFTRVALLKTRKNAGLARTRNAGFAFADAPFVLPLDADNILLPKCLETCLKAITGTNAAAAYATIQEFGDGDGMRSDRPWSPGRFVGGNYIDAMALIRKSAWAAIGGYQKMEIMGWEDYELWCRFVEDGFRGTWIPDTLSKYRVHARSMLQTCTDIAENRKRLVAEIKAKHPWLDAGSLVGITDPSATLPPDPLRSYTPDEAALPKLLTASESADLADVSKVSSVNSLPPRPRTRQRLEEMLPVMRCPVTGQAIRILSEDLLVTADGSRQWPLVNWRPIFFGNVAETKRFPDSHLSNPVPTRAIELIKALPGHVLNMSAGGTREGLASIIELETAIFRNTDIVGDAHCLPFADNVFDAVLAINAFEHYREPDRVVSEILRVLKPGGKVFIHTAFLQPLHEPPWHFFNCTRFGLLQWFKQFELVDVCVSENFNPIFALSWQADELLAALHREMGPKAARHYGEMSLRDVASFWNQPACQQDGRWLELRKLSQAAQEKLAAGFEFIGRKSEPKS